MSWLETDASKVASILASDDKQKRPCPDAGQFKISYSTNYPAKNDAVKHQCPALPSECIHQTCLLLIISFSGTLDAYTHQLEVPSCSLLTGYPDPALVLF